MSISFFYPGFAYQGYESKGMHSRIIRGTAEIKFECKVNASATYPGSSVGNGEQLSSSVEVLYRIRVTPVELSLTGTLPVTDGLKSGARDQVLVGQKITAKINGATLIKWTLPTEAFKSYVVTKTNNNWASVLNPILPSDLTGSNPLAFSCVVALPDASVNPTDPIPTGKELEIKCECKALGNPVILTKLLRVVVPDSALVSIIKNRNVAVSEYPSGSGRTGIWVRTQGNTDAPAAIYFVGRVDTPEKFVNASQNSGIFQFVQLIREQRYKTLDNNTVVPTLTTSDEFFLDTAYPYAPLPPAQWIANRPTYPMSAQDSDTPGTQTASDVKRIEVRDEKFEMYLMYQPPGVDSQWVPLRVMYWEWKADASRPEGGWASWPIGTPAGTLIGGSDAVSTAKHPIWSHSTF